MERRLLNGKELKYHEFANFENEEQHRYLNALQFSFFKFP